MTGHMAGHMTMGLTIGGEVAIPSLRGLLPGWGVPSLSGTVVAMTEFIAQSQVEICLVAKTL